MAKPLSETERPTKLVDFIGQKHLVGKNGIVAKMIANKFLSSLIFYGYPGIGKTSLATLICREMNVPFSFFNASVDKKERLTEILALSKNAQGYYVLIIDEIHRLNKDKQDILLNSLEKGSVILFATTTENPFFVINPAIRSRCQILQLENLNEIDLLEGLKKIASKNDIKIEDKSLIEIISKNGGDYRSSINFLEFLAKTNKNQISYRNVKDSAFETYQYNFKDGDEIHDLKSALHKSIRGSDPDAAIYYLARLIKSGDLIAISRRIMACAYEDIGLANPTLISRIHQGIATAKEVGFPEATQILACLVIELSLSPKSNAAHLAIYNALEDVNNGKIYKVPNHLRDQSYASAIKLGIGGYKFPHDYVNAWIQQDYLPKSLLNKKYYQPKHSSKIEQKMLSYWDIIKNK